MDSSSKPTTKATPEVPEVSTTSTSESNTPNTVIEVVTKPAKHAGAAAPTITIATPEEQAITSPAGGPATPPPIDELMDQLSNNVGGHRGGDSFVADLSDILPTDPASPGGTVPAPVLTPSSISMWVVAKLAGPSMGTQIARTLSVVFMYLIAAKLTRAEFAGISLGLGFSNISLLTFGVGIGMVLDTLSTQQYGADPKSPKQGLFWRRAVICFLCWCLPMWISYFFVWSPLVHRLFGPAVGANVLLCLKLSPLSNIPQGILFCTQKSLNAQKKVQYPMFGQLVTCAVMFPACYYGVQSGVTGICLALGVARSSGLMALFIISWNDKAVRQTFGKWTLAEVMDKEDSMRFLKLLPHSIIICVAERWALEGFSIMAGLLGPVSQNAYSIAISITNTLFAMAVGGYTAANALVGNSLGQGSPDLAKYAAKLSLYFIFTVTSIGAAILVVFPEHPVRFYTKDPKVMEEAISVLRVAPIMLIFDNIAYTYQGVFRACGDMHFLSKIVIASHWVVSLPLAAALAFKTELRVQGIILGLMFGLIIQCAFSLHKHYKQDWQALSDRAIAQAKVVSARRAKIKSAAVVVDSTVAGKGENLGAPA